MLPSLKCLNNFKTMIPPSFPLSKIKTKSWTMELPKQWFQWMSLLIFQNNKLRIQRIMHQWRLHRGLITLTHPQQTRRTRDQRQLNPWERLLIQAVAQWAIIKVSWHAPRWQAISQYQMRSSPYKNPGNKLIRQNHRFWQNVPAKQMITIWKSRA